MLPRSVLISPLWATTRYGCASGHDGNVLVLKRWWTSARRRLEVGIAQVEEELGQLRRGQHALPDARAAGQADDVERLLLGEVERVDLVLEALADDVELALEGERVRRRRGGVAEADEDLAEDRLGPARRVAEGRIVGRDVAPAEDDLILVADQRLEARDQIVALRRVVRQEDEAGAVAALLGQREAERGGDLAQEPIGDLDQDAGAVAGVDLAAAGAAVLEVVQQLEALRDDRARGLCPSGGRRSRRRRRLSRAAGRTGPGPPAARQHRRGGVRDRRLEKVALPDARAGRTVRGVFVHVGTPKGNAAAEDTCPGLADLH